jgi:molybdate transport system substrate-binding protein
MSHLMKRFVPTLIILVVCAVAHIVSLLPAKAAEAVRIYSAGSLVAPLKEAIAASGIAAEPVFGPAGLLRQRLENGEKADIFLSADLAQPRKLVEQKKSAFVIPFARNKLCALSRTGLGVTDENLLDKMLDPNVRLATSTPGADPGGDYAWAMFARAEAIHAGAKSSLEAKALKLIGSPNAMVPIAGKTVAASIFLADKADIVVYYCSGQADTLRDVEGLVSRALPAGLEVPAVYGMTFTSESPDAYRFALFLLSDQGQAILKKYELIPIL